MTRIRMATVVVALTLPAALNAQGDCFPSASSNEAQTFAILSVPLAFTGARAPSAKPRGIAFGLEIANLPRVSRAIATPTTCRPGKGPENTAPIPLIVRPRLAAAVEGFLVEVGWIPPVSIGGVTANLLGLAIGRPFALTPSLTLGVRAHAVVGSLRAPITCDDDALDDPASECFGGTRSDDRWRPGVYGLEAVVGGGSSRMRPHAGVGYARLQPRFRVNFTNAQGETDRRRVEVDLDRVALFGGVTVPLGVVRVTGEAYATIGDAVTARIVLRTPLR